jgi:hypothetical protein
MAIVIMMAHPMGKRMEYRHTKKYAENHEQ